MKTIGIFLFALLFGAGLFAQKKVDLLGTVTDTTGTPLPGATVVLIQAKDSVLAQFGITANDGRFILRKVPAGNYLLQVTYVGYDMFFKPVALTGDSSEVQLGQLPLRPATSTLETVQVTAEHIPMRIVGDTVEYNADAFKTQPGAVVEDLLKKLPGVEVEPDGTIKAQGQKVENVLVEGKEFFGKDPTIATKNLPAETVDKVQVFDKKSEQAEFTGIDDGKEERTINLQLKEDKKSGTFGNVSLGGGALYTPEGDYDFDRYTGRFMVNHFNSNTQLSFIGGSNNINETIFDFDDYMGFLGGPSNMGSTMILDSDAFDPEIMGTFLGTSRGLNAMRGAGVNLNKEFGPSFLGQKTMLNFSYFFNHNQNSTDLASRRENIVESESFSETLSSLSETVNMGHRFNLTLRHELDSSQHVVIQSNLQLREGEFDKAASRFAFDAVNSSQSLSRSGANSDVAASFHPPQLPQKGSAGQDAPFS
ncbi:MAG: hypothetical protein KatS3mg029_0792 [Saprospiraceae bacterium]|nr:MAG: hypothetical protein KatS3mg029_0792 [Saprospiraceae bacterium]